MSNIHRLNDFDRISSNNPYQALAPHYPENLNIPFFNSNSLYFKMNIFLI